MQKKHGETHSYVMGCRCVPCVDYYRVCQGMYKRRNRDGVYWITHHGALELRYPEATLKWITRGATICDEGERSPVLGTSANHTPKET